MDEKEDCIVDTEGDVFYHVLSLGSAKEIKEKLSSMHSEPIYILNLAKNTINKFFPEQSFYFPDFVKWCALNYSQLERVIMNKNGSKIFSRVTAQGIRDLLRLSESNFQNSEPFNELEITKISKESSVEDKSNFL